VVSLSHKLAYSIAWFRRDDIDNNYGISLSVSAFSWDLAKVIIVAVLAAGTIKLFALLPKGTNWVIENPIHSVLGLAVAAALIWVGPWLHRVTGQKQQASIHIIPFEVVGGKTYSAKCLRNRLRSNLGESGSFIVLRGFRRSKPVCLPFLTSADL